MSLLYRRAFESSAFEDIQLGQPTFLFEQLNFGSTTLMSSIGLSGY